MPRRSPRVRLPRARSPCAVPSRRYVVALLLLAVGAGLGGPAGSDAWAASPAGALPLPPSQPPMVMAAPRAPVRRVGGAPPPVIHASEPSRNRAPHPGAHAAPARNPAPPARPEPPQSPAVRADIGSVSGLPLPRFAALRSSAVDLRAGPGLRYPIRWVYHRLGMPVEIAREFAVWREVVMPDGTRGWMHEATLTGRRDGLVIDGRHTLRGAAAATARPVAVVEPGVVLRILHCDAGAAWCRVAAASFQGWLPRADFWGTFPGEQVAAR